MKEIVNKKLKALTKQSFTDESNIYEIGIDSLDFVELITEVEGEYNIEISDEELMSIKKVSDITTILESKIK